jgi:hypothetical protein
MRAARRQASTRAPRNNFFFASASGFAQQDRWIALSGGVLPSRPPKALVSALTAEGLQAPETGWETDMAVEIHRVILPKDKLAAIPKDERVLLLLMGHVTNEINVFSKLILMMRKEQPERQIEDFAEGGQIFIVMRTLIGKLHEAWEMFRARAQSNKAIAEAYIMKLDDEGKAVLKTLNDYFGKKNAVTEIRNKVSFHYKDENNLMEKNFQRLPATEPWELYLSKTHGNTFYYASEMVATGSALSIAGKIDPKAETGLQGDIQAFSELSKDVLDVSKNLTTLFSILISEIISKHIPDPEVKTEKWEDGYSLASFTLPYFFDEDEDDWTKQFQDQPESVAAAPNKA